MVVELSLAAVVPGALVGLHYGVQMSRPLFGHGSDVGADRTRWIIGGLALLALAGTGAAATTFLFEESFSAGIAAAMLCFALIGLGVGACGTSLLALLASRTAPARRPAAATIVWMMMIAGIVVTAISSSAFLDPYSHGRLVAVTAIAGAIALLLASYAVWRIEREAAPLADEAAAAPPAPFRESFAETWADGEARLFTIFVFVSMLAYSTQDLILEPFGGLLFGMTPGETTALSGVQHSGVFLGMALVGVVGSLLARGCAWVVRGFIILGCVGSGLALAGLALAASVGPDWPIKVNIFALGFANGAFAVAAIGAMMTLAGVDGKRREGVRMGLWGAAQAIAFGLGGVLGTIALDISRLLSGDVAFSFAFVFSAEAAMFLVAAALATRIGGGRAVVPPDVSLHPAE